MAVTSLSAAAGVSAVFLPRGRFEASKVHPLKHYNGVAQRRTVAFCLNQKEQAARLDKLSLTLTYKPPSTYITRVRSSSVVCSGALNARCATEGQTQTMEKPTSVIQNVPGKEKSPLLDDGGTGLPPRDDSGGGGGGGGGGGNFSGGFFFFGFLAFLGFLKDKESEGDYRDSRQG